MPRLPNWQLRTILPALVFTARATPGRNLALEETITELCALAQRRGLTALLAQLEHDAARAQAAMLLVAGVVPRNGDGPAPAGPSRAVSADEEASGEAG